MRNGGCDDAVIIIKISVCIVFIAVAYCDGRFDLAAVYDDRGAAFKPSFGWVENPVFAGDLESCERLSVGADAVRRMVEREGDVFALNLHRLVYGAGTFEALVAVTTGIGEVKQTLGDRFLVGRMDGVDGSDIGRGYHAAAGNV